MVPSPTTELMLKLPPCSSTKDLERARPSPVPSCWRECWLSICSNGCAKRAISSFEIPIPVSVTWMIRPADLGSTAIRTIPPSGVNLIALVVKFKRICLTARGSASISGVWLPSYMSLRRFSSARPRTMRITCAIISDMIIGSVLSVILPASILDISKISLIKDNKCWPEKRMSLTYSL